MASEAETSAAGESDTSLEGDADGDPAITIDLLQFQQDIVEELLTADGLTVLGKGMGLCTVAAALLMVHHASKRSGGVVVILGA